MSLSRLPTDYPAISARRSFRTQAAAAGEVEMSSWRIQHAKRQVQERERQKGMEGVSMFVGIGVAGALLALGVWCFLVDAVPIATRIGTVWVTGTRKLGFGLLTSSLGTALHFGFVWSRIASLRPAFLPALSISLAGTIAGMLLAMGI